MIEGDAEEEEEKEPEEVSELELLEVPVSVEVCVETAEPNGVEVTAPDGDKVAVGVHKAELLRVPM